MVENPEDRFSHVETHLSKPWKFLCSLSSSYNYSKVKSVVNLYNMNIVSPCLIR